MPEIEEMEWIPICEELLVDRFRGLRAFLIRLYWRIRCDPYYYPFPDDDEEEEVIEF